jgi:hypothetical protein
MGGMLHETTAEGGLSLQVEHAFLREDALRIHELIERSAPGTPVEIDLGRARDCHAVALAMLARDIVRGRVRVALHGTSHHQERILGYLGVRAADRAAS